MGVTHLWPILQPTAKAIKLEDLKNKTLAVDLSIWLCETSLAKYNSEVLKPQLRNIFFRCQHLLKLGCTLIFITEGDIIELKKHTMEKRNNLRFGKKDISETSTSTDSYESHLCKITKDLSLAANKPKIKKRGNFEVSINECCEMLNLMGIATIRSPCGEAEKSCAYLNLIGKCDAVISEDSDVFLYGAKTVYRNFCVDKQTALETSIEEYSMFEIESKLGYTREMLISLSLLLGCDYDTKGVPGCGVQQGCKFLNETIELEKQLNCKISVLNLMRRWQSDDYESKGLIAEDKIRRLVCNNKDEAFPNEKIIREYMFIDENHKSFLIDEFNHSYKWRRPSLRSSQKFNNLKQAWEFKYTAEKFVPLIILYELTSSERSIVPLSISKVRKKAFIEYYEVIWSKMETKNSWNDEDMSDLKQYTTLEKPDKFEMYYPELVEEFKKNLPEKKQPKIKKKKNEKLKEVDNKGIKKNVILSQKCLDDDSIIVLNDSSSKNDPNLDNNDDCRKSNSDDYSKSILIKKSANNPVENVKKKKKKNSEIIVRELKILPSGRDDIICFEQQSCVEETKSILKKPVSKKKKNIEIIRISSNDSLKSSNQENILFEYHQASSKQITSNSDDSDQEIIFLDENDENCKIKRFGHLKESKVHASSNNEIKSSFEETKSILIKKPPKHSSQNRIKIYEKNFYSNNNENQTLFDTSKEIPDNELQRGLKQINNNENSSLCIKPSFDYKIEKSLEKFKEDCKATDYINIDQEYRESKIQIQNSAENDYYIISSSDDEIENKKVSQNTENSDVNDLLTKFDGIRLESIKKPNKVENQPEKNFVSSSSNCLRQNSALVNKNDERENSIESPLPFLMRMKKCCKGASIFDN